jgi:hypothetical protein
MATSAEAAARIREELRMEEQALAAMDAELAYERAQTARPGLVEATEAGGFQWQYWNDVPPPAPGLEDFDEALITELRTEVLGEIALTGEEAGDETCRSIWPEALQRLMALRLRALRLAAGRPEEPETEVDPLEADQDDLMPTSQYIDDCFAANAGPARALHSMFVDWEHAEPTCLNLPVSWDKGQGGRWNMTTYRPLKS